MSWKETPDRYVLLKMRHNDQSPETLHILSGWYGSYLAGESWRLSTPLISIKSIEEGWFEATTKSGTGYLLSPHGVGYTSWTSSLLSNFRTKYEIIGVIDEEREVFDLLVESSEGCIHPNVPV